VEFFSFDESYLQRLRGGDFPTEQHFVDYFGQLLLIKLRSRLRSSQTVDDIRQETFVRVLKAVRTGGVRSAEGLGSFVNSICNNVLQEHYRSSARSVSSQDDTPLDPPDTRAGKAHTFNAFRERSALVASHILRGKGQR
jgi:RNA polymerase sigma-70 factor, ECF subfamily